MSAATSITVRVPLRIRRRPGRKTVVTPLPAAGADSAIPTRADPVLVKALAPGFFARGDLATPVKIGLVTVALNLALNLTLAPLIGHVGIALATSLAAWANAALLAAVLRRRRHWRPDRRLRRALPRLAASAALMAAGILLLLWWVPVPAGMLARVGLVGGVVALGLVLYVGAAQASGGMDLREVMRLRRPAA
jgi:putative peptidoglycan lipid II flippase